MKQHTYAKRSQPTRLGISRYPVRSSWKGIIGKMMEYATVSDMSPAGGYDKFGPNDEDYPLQDAPKKATGEGLLSVPCDTNGSRLGCLPNVAYHIEHLHLSPRGMVSVFERSCHISIRGFETGGGIERRGVGKSTTPGWWHLYEPSSVPQHYHRPLV